MKSVKTTALLLMLFAAACAPAPAASTPDLIASVVAATLTVVAGRATATAFPTQTPPATPGSVVVVTIAENVNLRTGPGTLFTVSRVMKTGTRLQVLGIAPGGELHAAWLSVLNDEGIRGWVDGRLVSDWGGLSLAVVQPQGVQVVRGLVKDEAGQPLSGVSFAIYQGNGNAVNARRTDVSTDRAGYFYAFLPLSATGAWTVEYVGTACPSSVLDANCVCLDPGACGPTDPPFMLVTLPLGETLSFIWK